MFGYVIKPNFEFLRNTILRKTKNCKIPMLEINVDIPIIEMIVEEKFIRYEKCPWIFSPRTKSNDELEKLKHNLDLLTKFYLNMGYDFISYNIDNIGLPIELGSISKPSHDTSNRIWAPSSGEIKTWDDFEVWCNRKDDINYFPLEYIAKNIPEGMKIILVLDGPMEALRWLLGLNFLISFVDNLDLVSAIISKICDMTCEIVSNISSLKQVGAICLGDDLGYNTSTVISPTDIKKLLIYLIKIIFLFYFIAVEI